PYDQVARVDVYIVSVAASSDPDTLGSGGPGTIATPHRAYNLLELGNGSAAELGEGILPAGPYVQFFVTIDGDSSSITLKNGTVLGANAGALADASITLLVVKPVYPADEATWGVLGTARSDATGRFRLPYASPGSYVLALDAPASSAYGSLRVPGVVVSIGAETKTGTLAVPLR